MAFTLATGVGVSGMQLRVNELQSKARAGEEFSETDRRFVRNLYTCLAKGARLTIVLRQSAAMMHRYLSCTGEPLGVESRIFVNSGRVRDEMTALKRQAADDAHAPGGLRREYHSAEFYMADATSFDSAVGLYVGRLILRLDPTGHRLLWRAEMPWAWPAYAGDRAARVSFAIPNIRSLLPGAHCALNIENGLGGYLTRLGLAKSFLVYSEWTESLAE